MGSAGVAAPPRSLSDVELFLAGQEEWGGDRRTTMAGAGHHNNNHHHQQEQQQQQQQQQQQLQSRAAPARDAQLKQRGPLSGRVDLAVQWEAVAQPGTPPHRGLSTTCRPPSVPTIAWSASVSSFQKSLSVVVTTRLPITACADAVKPAILEAMRDVGVDQ